MLRLGEKEFFWFSIWLRNEKYRICCCYETETKNIYILVCGFLVWPIFHSWFWMFLRPTIQTFCSLFKVRQHCIECIYHDIVVGICSKLFMRLPYYIHSGYDKKLLSHIGARTEVLLIVSRLGQYSQMILSKFS